MTERPKRPTLRPHPEIPRPARPKAAERERPIPEPASPAVRAGLAEDAEDRAAFEERARERSLPFEDVVKRLRRRHAL